MPPIIRAVRDILGKRGSLNVKESIRYYQKRTKELEVLIDSIVNKRLRKILEYIIAASEGLISYSRELIMKAKDFYARVRKNLAFRIILRVALLSGVDKVAQYGDRLAAAGKLLRVAWLTITL